MQREFDRAISKALAQRHAPRSWRLPPILARSISDGKVLHGADAWLPGFVDYYCRQMPTVAVEQALDGSAAGELRRAPLVRDSDGKLVDMPELGRALAGLYAALGDAGLDARAHLGAPTPAALLAARPSLLALQAGTLLGAGLPMVGAYPAERELIAREIAEGNPPFAVADLRLAGNLVHELCHGRARESDELDASNSSAAPWMILEAAALHLGAHACTAHVFPTRPGEAVPGVSLFVLLGAALARRVGRRALWSLLVEPTSLPAVFGWRGAIALEVAAAQDLLLRRAPPFARDPLAAERWVRLLDAALGSSPLDNLIDDLAQRPAHESATHAPNLLDAAARVPWSELPWWREEPSPADEELARFAVLGLFQEHRLAPTFQTWPSELPSGRATLNVSECLLFAGRRATGVFAEPATWLYPPPLCRALAERDVKQVAITGCRREDASRIAQRLLALANGRERLPSVVELEM